MNHKNRWIFLLLAIATAVDIYGITSGSPLLRYLTKPLLMPLLILAFVTGHDRKNVYSRLLISGLFFSWLGDIFLMMEGIDGIYFILGLSCFLTAHILYISYFLKIQPQGKSFLHQYPFLLVIVGLYGAGLLYLLWPGLGPLKIPVVLYAIIICTMLSLALWQYKRIHTKTAVLFITGAALFVLSDSLLAIHKFRQPIPYGGMLIMITYVAAQFFIVLGSLSHQQQQVPQGQQSSYVS
jgi:uncharacterized membrane protein YhhN